VKAKHANGEHSWGVNGDTGKIVDMKTYGLYESASVKVIPLSLPFHLHLPKDYSHRSKPLKQPSRHVFPPLSPLF